MQDNDNRPWVTVYNQWGDATGTLAGSRDGLEKLKDRIDKALATGESQIGDDLRGDFQDVRIAATYPEDEKETTAQKWTNYGCLAGLVVCFGVFIFGCYSIFSLFFDN